MTDTFYTLPPCFPQSQGDTWTYLREKQDGSAEVTYLIEGFEHFHGIAVPRKVQEDNPVEYFCTQADPVLGIRDFKHNIGMTGEHLIYTPPTNVIPARMRVGDIHYNTTHLFRHNEDGSIRDEGHFYDTTIFEAVEDVEVPAGAFEDCLRLTLIRDDVFSDLVVNVVVTQWLVPAVGIVRSRANVTIYSPAGGDPFIVESTDLLKQATIGGKRC